MAKDFFACNGCIGHGTAVREEHDYYATPPEAVHKLFDSEYFTPPPKWCGNVLVAVVTLLRLSRSMECNLTAQT